MKLLSLASRQASGKTKTDATVRRLSILSALSYAALGFSAPYLTIYLRDVGLSATLIGVLVSVSAILELSLTPMLNALADRKGGHRLLYKAQIGLIVGAHGVLALGQLPTLFLGGAFVTNQVNGRPSMEMLNQLTMTRLDQMRLPIFGKVRMWGSAGWAIASIISGTMVALGGYVLAFAVSAVVRLAMFPFMAALPRETATQEERTETAPRQPVIYLLMGAMFLFWIGLSSVILLLWIHMRENLGISPEHIGYFAATFAIAELAPMLFIDKIIARFGVRKVFIIGLAGMALEWLAYAFIPSWQWLLPIQAMRAMAFTMFTIGGVMIVSRVSKPVNVATNRALIMVTMPALATLVASPVAGWLYDNVGPIGVFSAASFCGGLATALLLLNYGRLGSVDAVESDDAQSV